MCWLCLLKLTLIYPFVDSVGRKWLWYERLSTLLTKINSDLLMCRLCWMKLTLICSCVDSVDKNRPWYDLSNEIDPDWIMCWLCRLWLTLIVPGVEIVDCVWSGSLHVSSVSNLIDPDMLRFLPCRMKSTLINPSVDSVEKKFTRGSAHVSTLWPWFLGKKIWQLCYLKLFWAWPSCKL